MFYFVKWFCVDCLQKQVDLALQKLFESKSDAFTTKEIRNFVRGMVMLGRFLAARFKVGTGFIQNQTNLARNSSLVLFGPGVVGISPTNGGTHSWCESS